MADIGEKFDVAIVGAGPAGSSCAIRVAKAGLKVIIIEQKKFPRGKLCGEFISPECLDHFAELGVLEKMSVAGGVPLEHTIFYARNGRSVTVPSEWFSAGSHALGLSRAEMDAQLLSRAREAGASVMEETTAANLLWDAGKVIGLELRLGSGNRFSVNAGLTIDATGRSKILARMVEKATSARIGTRAGFVAFKTHLSDAAIPESDCEIYAYRGGYGGSSRVEHGLNNLCFIVSTEIAKRFGGDAETILRETVFANKQARQSLANAKIVEDWLAVPIESYGRSKLAPAEGLITIGDAAAFIDPFTGSGMLLALESAKIAENVIERSLSKPNTTFSELAVEYNRQYALSFDRRLRVSSLVRRAAFVPFLAETLIKGLALSDRLTRLLAIGTRPAKSIDLRL